MCERIGANDQKRNEWIAFLFWLDEKQADNERLQRR